MPSHGVVSAALMQKYAGLQHKYAKSRLSAPLTETMAPSSGGPATQPPRGRRFCELVSPPQAAFVGLNKSVSRSCTYQLANGRVAVNITAIFVLRLIKATTNRRVNRTKEM